MVAKNPHQFVEHDVMGTIVSLHIFLEEHFHPALHKAQGDICSFLTTGWAFMFGFVTLAIAACFFFVARTPAGEGFYHRCEDWPPYVSTRIKTTYLYIATALLIAAVSMATVSQFPTAVIFLNRYTFGSVAWSILALIVTGDLARALPYEGMLGAKHAAFALHSAVIGLVLSPLCLLGGDVMLQAGWLTAGVTAVVTTLAVFAPSPWIMLVSVPISFLYVLVFIASVAGVFWPTSTSLGAYSYATNLYLGIISMSGFLMFYSFFFMLVAERMPEDVDSTTIFDPISAAILVFRYTLDVFMRIAVLLVGGGNGIFKKVCHFNAL